MKIPFPLAYKIRMTVALLAAELIIAMLFFRHLLSAIGPVKTPFYDFGLVGLAGLFVTDLVFLVYVLIHGKTPVPRWISFSALLFAVLGLGGALLNEILA